MSLLNMCEQRMVNKNKINIAVCGCYGITTTKQTVAGLHAALLIMLVLTFANVRCNTEQTQL